MENLLQKLKNNDKNQRFNALEEINNQILLSPNLINETILQEIINELSKLINIQNEPNTSSLACQTILNLLESLQNSSYLIAQYITPILVSKLSSPNNIENQEMFIDIIEILTHDQNKQVLKQGGLNAVLNYADFFSIFGRQKALAAAANMTRAIPQNDFSLIPTSIPLLVQQFQCENPKVVNLACLSLFRIFNQFINDKNKISSLIHENLILQLVSLLIKHVVKGPRISKSTFSSIIRLLIDLCYIDTNTILFLYENGVIKFLQYLFSSKYGNFQIEGENIWKKISNMQIDHILSLCDILLPAFEENTFPISIIDSSYSHKFSQFIGYTHLHSYRSIDFKKHESIWKSHRYLVSLIAQAILPNLIRIQNEIIITPTKLKCLLIILKMIHFMKADDLLNILSNNLKETSLMISILIWTKLDPLRIGYSVKIATLLYEKLPQIFEEIFIREGIFFRIQKISEINSKEQILNLEQKQQKTLKINQNQNQNQNKKQNNYIANYEWAINQAKIFINKIAKKKIEQNSEVSRIVSNIKKSIEEILDPKLEMQALSQISQLFMDEKIPLTSYHIQKTQLISTLVKYLSIFSDKTGKVNSNINIFETKMDNISLSFDHLQTKISKFTQFLFENLIVDKSQNKVVTPVEILVQKLHQLLSRFDTLLVKIYPTSTIDIISKNLKLKFQKKTEDLTLLDFPIEESFVNCLITTKEIEKMIFDQVQIPDDPFFNLPKSNQNTNQNTKSIFKSARNIRNSQTKQISTKLSQKRSMRVVTNSKTDLFGNKPNQESKNPKQKIKRHLSKIKYEKPKVEKKEKKQHEPSLHSKLHPLRLIYLGKTLDTSKSLIEQIFSISKEKNQPQTVTTIWNTKHVIYYERFVDSNDMKIDSNDMKIDSNNMEIDSNNMKIEFEEYSDSFMGFEILNLKKNSNQPKNPISSNQKEKSKIGIGIEKSILSFKLSSENQIKLDDPKNGFSKRKNMVSILNLMQILYSINEYFQENQNENKNENKNENQEIIQETKKTPQFKTLNPNLFISPRLNAKIKMFLEDPFVILTRTIPDWCETLIKLGYIFLFSFETRFNFFKLIYLDPLRSFHNFQAESEHHVEHFRNFELPRIPRQQKEVLRTQILKDAMNIMDSYEFLHGKSILEIQYFGEVGVGTGPSQEFFYLVSRELRKSSLNLWCDYSLPKTKENLKSKNEIKIKENLKSKNEIKIKENLKSKDEIKIIENLKSIDEIKIKENLKSIDEIKIIENLKSIDEIKIIENLKSIDEAYVHSPNGLFPKPLDKSTPNQNIFKMFEFMGKFVAKAIIDDRLLEFPISHPFFQAILGYPLTLTDLEKLEPELTHTLIDFSNICKEYQRTKDKSLKYKGAKIEDLYLWFILPGNDEMELKPNGKNIQVNLENLEEYLNLVLDFKLKKGIQKQVECFIAGFNEILPIESLKIFTYEEFDLILNGCLETWTIESLKQSIKCEHGYTIESEVVSFFLEFLVELSPKDQRKFIQFVTGSSGLPVGGIAKLSPQLVVVERVVSPYHPDSFLPTVMTCANYLKIPRYSSKKILVEKFFTAIYEGQGSFHLS